jgi:membrane AbrB-like protein
MPVLLLASALMLSPVARFIQRLLTRPATRIGLTLLLAWAAALLCEALHTPVPWMMGPLLATAFVTMAGGPTASATPLRNAGQWVIGGALGLYFTPQALGMVVGLWWVILLGIVWALALGFVAGVWLHRVHAGPGPLHMAGVTRLTTHFASPIGGASEMTLLGERFGAQTELIASAHSLRVLMVTLIIPFSLQWSGLHGVDVSLPGPRVVAWPGLALWLLLTGVGCWLMLRLRGANPWFLGALGVSMLLTGSGLSLSALPPQLTNAAQLVLAISLGVRFTPGFIHMAPRWMVSVALTTTAMIVLCAGFAWLLSLASGLHWATLFLGASPGGIAEMAITAKVLQLGVPVVTALQVMRLAAVLLLTEPMYRWSQRLQPSA